MCGRGGGNRPRALAGRTDRRRWPCKDHPAVHGVRPAAPVRLRSHVQGVCDDQGRRHRSDVEGPGEADAAQGHVGVVVGPRDRGGPCPAQTKACTLARVTNLAYDDHGSGEPVLFIAGSGGPGRTWHVHQVPDFTAAGYRAVTFDNRGIGATENADGFTTETMVTDTAELIEQLGLGPTRIVAASM